MYSKVLVLSYKIYNSSANITKQFLKLTKVMSDIKNIFQTNMLFFMCFLRNDKIPTVIVCIYLFLDVFQKVKGSEFYNASIKCIR